MSEAQPQEGQGGTSATPPQDGTRVGQRPSQSSSNTLQQSPPFPLQHQLRAAQHSEDQPQTCGGKVSKEDSGLVSDPMEKDAAVVQIMISRDRPDAHEAEFRNFRKLAPELQDMIWEFAIADLPARTVHLSSRFSAETFSYDNHAWTLSLTTSITSPTAYKQKAMAHIKNFARPTSIVWACRRARDTMYRKHTLDLGFDRVVPGNFDNRALIDAIRDLQILVRDPWKPHFPTTKLSEGDATRRILTDLSKDVIFLDFTNEFPNVMTFMGFSQQFLASPAFLHITNLQLHWEDFYEIEATSVIHRLEHRTRGKVIVPKPRQANTIAAAVSANGREQFPLTNSILSMPSLKRLVFSNRYPQSRHMRVSMASYNRRDLGRLKDAVVKIWEAERRNETLVFDETMLKNRCSIGLRRDADNLEFLNKKGIQRRIELGWVYDASRGH